MTTAIDFDLVCKLLAERTGQKWRTVGDKFMYCWNSTEVLIREDGLIRIIFDPPGEQFAVGVEWDDVYLGSGDTIEQILDGDPRLLDVLSGKVPAAHYFNAGREDWRGEKAVPMKPHERALFSLNVFGLFTLVVKV